jgi:hypothetical protein
MTTDDTDTGTTATADPAAGAELADQLEQRRRDSVAHALDVLAEADPQGDAARRAALEGGAGSSSSSSEPTPDSSDQQAVDAALLERDAAVDPQVGRADPLNTGAHADGEPSEAADVDAQVADAGAQPVATHADGEPSETAGVADPPPVVAAPTPPERS